MQMNRLAGTNSLVGTRSRASTKSHASTSSRARELVIGISSYIHQDTNNKIVLISNYTQTLDIFDKLCRSCGYSSLRLDGTINVTKHQKLVDKFNDPNKDEFSF